MDGNEPRLGDPRDRHEGIDDPTIKETNPFDRNSVPELADTVMQDRPEEVRPKSGTETIAPDAQENREKGFTPEMLRKAQIEAERLRQARAQVEAGPEPHDPDSDVQVFRRDEVLRDIDAAKATAKKNEGFLGKLKRFFGGK